MSVRSWFSAPVVSARSLSSFSVMSVRSWFSAPVVSVRSWFSAPASALKPFCMALSRERSRWITTVKVSPTSASTAGSIASPPSIATGCGCRGGRCVEREAGRPGSDGEFERGDPIVIRRTPHSPAQRRAGVVVSDPTTAGGIEAADAPAGRHAARGGGRWVPASPRRRGGRGSLRRPAVSVRCSGAVAGGVSRPVACDGADCYGLLNVRGFRLPSWSWTLRLARRGGSYR